ncbi:uncharacterized protein LOC126666150 [Mercurialis annua]|uniref:uncharacterized protein LOC126666150 n=1 Tax=Mercurialis annua TaxID=3986 RepID=UPI0024AF6040|nr:uncharacterized protein LOC126666150 [Mercurialis annua]XP_055961222.1 uncharacterized protein LOC126666150 [Mercurialis annua]
MRWMTIERLCSGAVEYDSNGLATLIFSNNIQRSWRVATWPCRRNYVNRGAQFRGVKQFGLAREAPSIRWMIIWRPELFVPHVLSCSILQTSRREFIHRENN